MSGKRFWLILGGLAAVVFTCNAAHSNQQIIFFREYVPIATNLLNGSGYSILPHQPVLYPMWGYSLLTVLALTTGYSLIFLGIFQAILSLVTIRAFYRLFRLEKKYWHIPLFIPFITLLSVRWPDAIVASMLVFALMFFVSSIQKSSNKYAFYSGCCLGLICNFRSEYLGLLIILALVMTVSLLRRDIAQMKVTLITVLTSLFLLLPWAIYSYSIDKHVRVAATNGGGVFYISLGQLPNNPWHITHSDSTAFTESHLNGIDDPYSPRGDSLLTSEFVSDIEKFPASFTKKIAYNLLSTVYRGVYTGEFVNITLDSAAREAFLGSITSGNISQDISRLSEFRFVTIIVFAIQQFIHIFFIPIFDLLILLTIIYCWKYLRKSFLLKVVLIVLLYKFALVGLVQYEPRHMNAIYLLVLGTALLYVQNRKGQTLTSG
ncbi:MAG TPA: hypothetical protein VEW28_00255 [Candidatus Kapabacteria bacterium]|nr:hypothetical protein [Candidatus Kapabacteria bacterium]